MNRRVEILIDELVLHGFSAADRDAIGEALSRELQRLVASGDPARLAGLRSLSAYRAESITLEPGGKTPGIGSQVAQAVYGSLTR